MDQVIAADRRSVAVAGDDDHVHLRLGHLDAGGKGDGTAVGGMQCVIVHVSCRAGGAADSADDGNPFLGKAHVIDGLADVPHQNAVAAAGAPDVRKAVGTHSFLY